MNMHATDRPKMYVFIQKRTLIPKKSINRYFFCVHQTTFYFSKNLIFEFLNIQPYLKFKLGVLERLEVKPLTNLN